MPKTIGVLGGMGPAATAHLHAQLVACAQRDHGARQDTDFPPLLVFSLPVAGFGERGFADYQRAQMRTQVLANAERVTAAGAELLLICCNTVHCFYDDLRQALDVPVIDAISLAAQAVADSGARSPLVLSSRTTRDLGLYERALADCSLAPRLLADDAQERLDTLILAVMGGQAADRQREELRRQLSDGQHDGADGFLVGCSELSLLAPRRVVGGAQDLPVIDSMRVAVAQCLRLAYAEG